VFYIYPLNLHIFEVDPKCGIVRTIRYSLAYRGSSNC